MITSKINSYVAESGITTGLCVVFVRHTSASLIIQENADPDVLIDLENFMAKLVPEDGRSYIHSAEGPDDMPAIFVLFSLKLLNRFPSQVVV